MNSKHVETEPRHEKDKTMHRYVVNELARDVLFELEQGSRTVDQLVSKFGEDRRMEVEELVNRFKTNGLIVQ